KSALTSNPRGFQVSSARDETWITVGSGPVMKRLTDDLVQQYRDTGYLAPVRVLSTAEAAEIRAKLEAFEADAGPLAGKLRQKSHLLFTWLNDLIRHERMLYAV